MLNLHSNLMNLMCCFIPEWGRVGADWADFKSPKIFQIWGVAHFEHLGNNERFPDLKALKAKKDFEVGPNLRVRRGWFFLMFFLWNVSMILKVLCCVRFCLCVFFNYMFVGSMF